MFALAIVANFFVLGRLVVENDPAATTANIAASPELLRAGILAFLLIVLLDITPSGGRGDLTPGLPRNGA